MSGDIEIYFTKGKDYELVKDRISALTHNKRYKVIEVTHDGCGAIIIDDVGNRLLCYIDGSSHLQGLPWRVVGGKAKLLC